MLTIYIIALASALVLYYLLTKPDKYPPGPFAFPMIGNLPQLAWSGSISAFATFYRKRYGGVFTFEFGGYKRVILSGYETIHLALVKNADVTSNRSINSMTQETKKISKESPGFFFAPFPHWKTLRSFTISTLREEGMGKASMEPRIHEEVEQYIDHFIKPNLGKPVEMSHNIYQAMCNIISQLVFGKRFDYDDSATNAIISGLDEAVKLNLKTALFESLPFGGYLAKPFAEKEQQIARQLLRPAMERYIEEHRRTLDRDHPRDVVDRYLIHMTSENSQRAASFTDENAWLFCLHLFGAGLETTATALRWGLLFMCLHPHIQHAVQSEIDKTLGSERCVTYKDKLELPYTEAVCLETLRAGNIVPAALPHMADTDLEVNGKFIPAGADLMLNMSSVLYDETVFEEPDKFKPERYLTGDIALKKQRTIPFGIGRRACPGESLARMEFFIFFVTFLQRFNVSLPHGSTATAEPAEYIIRGPKPYQLIFTDRH